MVTFECGSLRHCEQARRLNINASMRRRFPTRAQWFVYPAAMALRAIIRIAVEQSEPVDHPCEVTFAPRLLSPGYRLPEAWRHTFESHLPRCRVTLLLQKEKFPLEFRALSRRTEERNHVS